MSDFKSKLPDLNELASMGGKLFNGIKGAVNEIIDDYKKKRAPVAETKPAADTATKEVVEPVVKAEKPAVKKKPVAKKTSDKASTK